MHFFESEKEAITIPAKMLSYINHFLYCLSNLIGDGTGISPFYE